DAALVEIVINEVVRIGVGTIGHPPSSGLALIGLLDLDDVGAEPGQHLGTGRARLKLGEVEHLDSLECRCRLSLRLDLLLPYLILHGDPSLRGCFHSISYAKRTAAPFALSPATVRR